MKNLIINGSQFLGVEKILFNTVEGSEATFVDEDTKYANEWAAVLSTVNIIQPTTGLLNNITVTRLVPILNINITIS